MTDGQETANISEAIGENDGSSVHVTSRRDDPIIKPDDDKLGLVKQCAGVARFLLLCETPMTLAVQGGWGTGKTSFMRMLEHTITNGEDKDKACCIWFNTWQFSCGGGQEVFPAMVSTILSELGANPKSKTLKPWAKIVGRTAFRLGCMLTIGGVIDSDMAIGAITAEDSRQPKSNVVKDCQDYFKDIRGLKDELEKGLKKVLNSKRLIIFVDDLDRLDPMAAVNVLENMKNFLSVNRCVFVLALDHKVVETGLRAKYGSALGEEYSHKYFEKLIQVPYCLPVTSYDTRGYIESVFAGSDNNLDKNEKELAEIVFRWGDGNPRNIKRIFNAMKLEEVMAEAEDGASMNKEEREKRLALSCLQVCHEDYFTKLVVSLKEGRDELSQKILAFLTGKTEMFEAFSSFRKFLEENRGNVLTRQIKEMFDVDPDKRDDHAKMPYTFYNKTLLLSEKLAKDYGNLFEGGASSRGVEGLVDDLDTAMEDMGYTVLEKTDENRKFVCGDEKESDSITTTDNRVYRKDQCLVGSLQRGKKKGTDQAEQKDKHLNIRIVVDKKDNRKEPKAWEQLRNFFPTGDNKQETTGFFDTKSYYFYKVGDESQPLFDRFCYEIIKYLGGHDGQDLL